jgi:uridine monophosphate synthetase
LVVGATFPEAVARVRAAAPNAWFLIPGIGAQGGDLEATLAASLRSDGLGAIINSSRGVTNAADHRQAALSTRDAINAARQEILSAPAGTPTEGTAPANYRLRSLVVELAELGAVRFGSFTLASGIQSPIYIDLRLLVSRPSLLARAAEAYTALLAATPCDRIAGVPYAALPIGTAVAIAADKPLIYPRKEAKEHGLAKLIEGAWNTGDRVTIIEDLITSGGSTIKTAETLREAGLVVEHAIVLIDREQGGVDNLAEAGITAHAVLTLTRILDILVEAGQIDSSKRQEVLSFLGKNQ